MTFAWMPHLRLACRACPSAPGEFPVEVNRLVASTSCPLGHALEISPPAWLSTAASAAEFDPGTLDCPTCSSLIDLEQGLPRQLTCPMDHAPFTVRSPSEAESGLVSNIVAIASREGSADVVLLDPTPVITRWKEVLASSAAYQETQRDLAPPERILELAKTGHMVIRQGVAARFDSPLEALELLAGDPDTIVRATVASQRLYRHERLVMRLVQDPHPRVRAALARNDAATPEALEILAGAPEAHVRRGVAGNFMTPVAVRARLARDPSVAVRLALASRPELAGDAARLLAEDPVPAVREARREAEREGQRILEAQRPPTKEELGCTTDDEYRRKLVEVYRH
ncbi:MAG: hypothetical protein RL653_3129 [Pseudomonadota bacterium]|jgi:hypothetical protein